VLLRDPPLIVALVALMLAVTRLSVLQFSRGNTQPSVQGTFFLFGLAAMSLGLAFLDTTSSVRTDQVVTVTKAHNYH
jgi:hypothetical protein